MIYKRKYYLLITCVLVGFTPEMNIYIWQWISLKPLPSCSQFSTSILDWPFQDPGPGVDHLVSSLSGVDALPRSPLPLQPIASFLSHGSWRGHSPHRCPRRVGPDPKTVPHASSSPMTSGRSWNPRNLTHCWKSEASAFPGGALRRIPSTGDRLGQEPAGLSGYDRIKETHSRFPQWAGSRWGSGDGRALLCFQDQPWPWKCTWWKYLTWVPACAPLSKENNYAFKNLDASKGDTPLSLGSLTIFPHIPSTILSKMIHCSAG